TRAYRASLIALSPPKSTAATKPPAGSALRSALRAFALRAAGQPTGGVNSQPALQGQFSAGLDIGDTPSAGTTSAGACRGWEGDAPPVTREGRGSSQAERHEVTGHSSACHRRGMFRLGVVRTSSRERRDS